MAQSEFDTYADDYETALEQGISLSGEDSTYFAQGRVDWVRTRLSELGAPSRTLLDFGCGTGTATPYLLNLPGAEHLVGVDPSPASLETARRRHPSPQAEFLPMEQSPVGTVDLAYCNGVFHHIPVAERPAALATVHAALRPGGMFGLWENNPWNPGTRMVMRRIPFDRDAITLSAPECRRMVERAGFEVVKTDFLFVFPSPLRRLRPLERRLTRLPAGAQYLVLARRS
ncbi:methyltransferase domain-containing protein [Solirubrobacter taibaiensis]|nr:methyltransferase domain-containing protein [Solirubrobacter taibaiensis]